MSQAGTKINYRSDPKNKSAVKATDGKGHKYDYKPSGKGERDCRKRVFDRFQVMRDDPIRKEAEKAWELGRKMVRMWAPERDAEDWGADIVLPDGFAAIQTYLQETIDANFRPTLEGVESSDDEKQWFNDAIFQHAMDTTEFDAEVMKARSGSAALGTYFTREEYRYETREVMDPTSFKNGKMQYTKKEIIDYDDVYTRAVRPENCYFDPGAEDQKYAMDCIYREVLDFEAFQEMYGNKEGFINTDKVVPAGSLDVRAGFFKMANDMDKNSVEVLHYENRLTDSYDVLANNVVIRDDPLPSKHKELSLDVWTFYPIEGQIYGMGIPQIIYTLVEERRTNRNQQLDRNTLQNSKMFLTNDLYDLDEDDLTPRPHGLIKINTNGLPLRDAIQPLEYGDTPMSSIRMDDTLIADQRQAHGMVASTEMQPGSTATQAAIMKESTQRRINLVNTLSARNTLTRLGKKKWSNVQFFYPAPRVERILEDNKWQEKKTYRIIKTPGMSFKVFGDPDNGEPLELKATEIEGTGSAKLDPTYARFMMNDKDVVIKAIPVPVTSKPIKQQQVNEMFDRVMSNPLVSRYADGAKAFKRMAQINDEDARDWMAAEGMTDADQEELAHKENMLFIDMARTGKVFMLPGTPNANEAHTKMHLQFTREKLYQDLPEAIQAAISNHILEENGSNPNTPNPGEAPGAGGAQAPTGGDVVLPGMPGGPDPGAGMGPVPGAPVEGGDVTQGNGPMPAPVVQ